MNETPKLLLDTHVWVWLMEGSPDLDESARATVGQSARGGQLIVAAISVWEVAMLERKGRLILSLPPLEWLRKALTAPGIGLSPLSPEIAVEACHLPGALHKDPADRIIVATARTESARLMTRDRTIIDYGSRGHLSVVPV